MTGAPHDEVERLIQAAARCRDFGEHQALTLRFNVAKNLLPLRERERAVARFIDALHASSKRGKRN